MRLGEVLQAGDGRWYRHEGGRPIGPPLLRCACPDGCQLGWGWMRDRTASPEDPRGLCGACYRDWSARKGPYALTWSAYLLPDPGDGPPLTFADYQRTPMPEWREGKAKRQLPPGRRPWAFGQEPETLGL